MLENQSVIHPGQPGRQSIQSVNGHLVSLYFVFVKNVRGNEATRKIGMILEKEPKFEWLEPPVPNGQKTVIYVLTAINQEEHEKKVREWAEDVWICWYSKHGQTIEKLVNDNF